MKKFINSLCLLLSVLFICVALIGCGQREEQAKAVWLYEWRGAPRRQFENAIIYDKRPGYIKFKAASEDLIIEHSGRYTVEN